MFGFLRSEDISKLIDEIRKVYLRNARVGMDIPFKVKFVFLGRTKLTFDCYNRQLVLTINRFSFARKEKLRALLEYLMLKLWAYKTFCPGDESLASQLIVQAIKASDSITGILAATIFVELLTDFYISHIDFDAFLRSLKYLRDRFVGFDVITLALTHTYNLMVGENVFPKIDEEYREIGQKIYDIIFAKNIMNPSFWPRIVGELATYIRSIIEYEEEISGDLFLYDYLEDFIPLIVLQMDKGVQAATRTLRSFYRSFKGSLSSAGPALKSGVPLPPRDILRYWYREKAKELVKVIIGSATYFKRSHKIKYPTVWSIGDPIEELDIFLSTSISPLIIPGYTTKKWEQTEGEPQTVHRVAPDILIIIDSSGSMGRLPGDMLPKRLYEQEVLAEKFGITYSIGSKFDIALTTAFGIVECALNVGSKVGVVNFSDVAYVCEFTRMREQIEDTLLIHQNGGTYLPVKDIMKALRGKEHVLIIVLSDAAIYNRKEAERFLRRLSRTHTLYFIHIEAGEKSANILRNIKHEGARIIRIESLDELPTKVLRIVAKYLEVF